MSRLICNVYRSPRHSEMYLYVDKQDLLARVPQALLERFGQPQLVMTMLLRADKKMAKVVGADIMAAIRDNGFYLQMPPLANDEMSQISRQNSKLGR